MNERIVKEAFIDELNKIAGSVKEDIIKGLGASLGAGKTVSGLAHFGKDLFGKSRASVEASIKAANPAASADDITKMVSAEVKRKDAPFNKTVDILSKTVTGAGIAHTIGKPLMEKLVVGSRSAQQAKLEKKLLAGLGIGAGAGIAGSMIHGRLNQTDTTYAV